MTLRALISLLAFAMLTVGIVTAGPPDPWGFHRAFLLQGLYEDDDSCEDSDDESCDDSSDSSGSDSSESDSSGSDDSSSGSGDDGESDDDREVVEFSANEIFFEYNSTDFDLGLHIFFDAVGWNEVEVIGPDGTIFEVDNGGGLNQIGSTEVFTESAEPPLDEDNLDVEIAEFLARFPAGEYRFAGETVDGLRLEGSAMLSHDLVAPPELVFPDPEAEENLADPDDTVIEWVDGSGPGDPEVERYEVVVEFEDEQAGEVFKYVVHVPADPDAVVQSLPVPPEWFEVLERFDGEYKAEIVAIAGDRNATIVETEFELDD